MTLQILAGDIQRALASKHQKPRVTENFASQIAHRAEVSGLDVPEVLAIAALSMGVDAIEPLLRGQDDRMLVRSLGLRRSYDVDPNAQRRFDVLLSKAHLPFGANRDVIEGEMRQQLSQLGESRAKPENAKSMFRVELGDGFVGHVDSQSARFFVSNAGQWYGSFALDRRRDGALVSSSSVAGPQFTDLGVHLKSNANVRCATLAKNAVRIGPAEVREIHKAIHGSRPHPLAPYQETTPSDLVRMLTMDFSTEDHRSAAGRAATELLTKLRKQYGKDIKIFASNRVESARKFEAQYDAPGAALRDADLNSADVLFLAGKAGQAISLSLSDPRTCFERAPKRVTKGPVSFEANLFGGTLAAGWTNVFSSRYPEGRSLDASMLETFHRANHGSAPIRRYRSMDVDQIERELIAGDRVHADVDLMRGSLERAIQNLRAMHEGETPKIFASLSDRDVHLAIGFEKSRALYEIHVEAEKVYPKTAAEKLLESSPEMTARLERIFEKLTAVPAPTQRDPVGRFEECTLVRVIDADTIDVVVNGTGERKRVRYLVVDTDESYDTTYKKSTPFGVWTKYWAKKNLEVGMPMRIEFDDCAGEDDVFGRKLGYVWYQKEGDWRNLNFELVARGLSTFNTKYGFPGQSEAAPNAKIIAQLQATAREEELGMWDPEATPPLCNGGYAERVERDLLRARSLDQWINEVAPARPDIFAPRRAEDFAKVQERAGQSVALYTAWFVPNDREAYFAAFENGATPTEPAVFQLEGHGQDEVWKLVVKPSPDFDRTVRALLDQEGHFRYLKGTVEKTDEGVSIVVASPDDVRADPAVVR